MKKRYNNTISNCVYDNSNQISKGKREIRNFSILFLAIIFCLCAADFAKATTFTVTKADDTNDNICDTDCSLREAIAAANAAATDDVIEFDASVFGTVQSIRLGGTELTITNNGSLVINGVGSHLLFINGSNFIDNTFIRSRVFRISPNSNVALNNLTVQGGDSRDETIENKLGGGIFNDNSALTLNNCRVSSNSTITSGGGVYNRLGTLNVNNSIFESNAAGSGGGIFNEQGTVSIANSFVNRSRAFTSGSGIFNSGDLTITNSTFFANSVSGQGSLGGGGIFNTGDANLVNTTISSNSADQFGGGILNSGSLDLQSVTVAYNFVRASSGTAGGGINNNNNGTINARNTIIGRNANGFEAQTDPNAKPSDFAGTLNSQGFNLIQDTSSITIVGNTTGNILNVDPLLTLFPSQFGGATLTHALKMNSPAIDAGDPNNFPATDQRGFPRPIDGDGNGSALPDIGAYETSRVTTPSTFVVTNTNDFGAGSLRGAIEASNATFGDDTINFDPNVFSTPQTIMLTNGRLEIADNTNLIINGPGADMVNISSNRLDGIFAVSVFGIVEFNDLTISNGLYAINSFGTFTLNNSIIRNNGLFPAIFSFGNATINNSSIKDNESAGIQTSGTMSINSSTIANNLSANNSCGAGIRSGFGRTTVTNSVIKNNSIPSPGIGGGICHETGIIDLINVTIAGNSASSGGGVLSRNGGTININNSTIASNSASSGGGISIFSSNGNTTGTVNLTNSIIANNTASNSADIRGTVNSQGYNLIENISGAEIVGDTTGNITGVDPQLDPNGLQNNGGLTETIALLANSRAIDAADPNNILPTDQRGFFRPIDGDGNGSALPDIGAFEFGSSVRNNRARFDFDGDGKTDVSVFRPDAGQWFYLRSIDGSDRGFQFGQGSDTPVPADFTGDGRTDVAFFRPSSGLWFILRSEDNSFYGFPFGQNGDIPAPGDFDGDGKADAAVFRPAIGTWFILNSSDGSVTTTRFGLNGDVPIVEDYDGDGRDDIAVFRPSEASWFLNRSTAGFIGFQFGAAGDTIPIPADFTGDGKADIAFFRPSSNFWFVLRSEDSSFYSFPFGSSGDIPAPGDYDGDGTADAAVFRPLNGTWFLQQSTAGNTALRFGLSGDIPLPSTLIP